MRCRFYGHYDDIGDQDWIGKNYLLRRYDELNFREHLTEMERRELDILACGTEEEYFAFLKENGFEKDHYAYNVMEHLSELELMELDVLEKGTYEEYQAFLKKHGKALKRLKKKRL